MSIRRGREAKHGAYTIDEFLPTLYPFEFRLDFLKIFHPFTWLLWLFRIAYDLFHVFQTRGDHPRTAWSLCAAFVAEFFLTLPEALTALDIALGLLSGKANQPRPIYKLSSDTAPAVDVLITCCGEPVSIILNTLKAAIAQDYPQSRFRVFVLDDGADQILRKAVEKVVIDLGTVSSPIVKYLSRPKDLHTKTYFKSGNLRFGIENSQRLNGGSEYLAGLDADMIVEPDWLNKLVPHLILDDRVACVCCPQVSCIPIVIRPWKRDKQMGPISDS